MSWGTPSTEDTQIIFKVVYPEGKQYRIRYLLNHSLTKRGKWPNLGGEVSWIDADALQKEADRVGIKDKLWVQGICERLKTWAVLGAKGEGRQPWTGEYSSSAYEYEIQLVFGCKSSPFFYNEVARLLIQIVQFDVGISLADESKSEKAFPPIDLINLIKHITEKQKTP